MEENEAFSASLGNGLSQVFYLLETPMQEKILKLAHKSHNFGCAG